MCATVCRINSFVMLVTWCMSLSVRSLVIAKTCRSFKDCYKRSIKNKDNKSVLSAHVIDCDCESIADFDVNILKSNGHTFKKLAVSHSVSKIRKAAKEFLACIRLLGLDYNS